MNLNFGYDPASQDSLVIICTKDVYFQRFGINRIKRVSRKIKKRWIEWIIGSLEVNDMIQRRKDWHRIRKSHYIYFSDKITVSTTDIPPIIANVKIEDGTK